MKLDKEVSKSLLSFFTSLGYLDLMRLNRAGPSITCEGIFYGYSYFSYSIMVTSDEITIIGISFLALFYILRSNIWIRRFEHCKILWWIKCIYDHVKPAWFLIEMPE